jgi:WD40 repeat protein
MTNDNPGGSEYDVDAPGAVIGAIGDRAQVTQRIEQTYNIYPASKDRPRITASLKMPLETLLKPHRLFGGREDELAALNHFVAQRTSGYLFVTGPSGYGKSALLANWIKGLAAQNQPVVYHFINRSGGNGDEAGTLEDLCEQLAAGHDLAGTLTESVPRLRRLYPRLLQIPPEEGDKVVVVLDGLDEARDWEPGYDLFPEPLPQGVFVVFSARTIAGKDWLADLRFPPGFKDQITLATLDLAGTGRLLSAALGAGPDWATQPGAAQAAHTVSGGDPYYLNYLLQDILGGAITSLDDLGEQPSGLGDYLDQWWNELLKAAKEKPVRDLLGYLLVAKGPLTRADLSDIGEDDELDAWTVDGALGETRRHLLGDDEEGYTLSHRRFQRYVAERRIPESAQKTYRDRLLDYCARWQETESTYALAHYVQHLRDTVKENVQDTEKAEQAVHLILTMVKDVQYLAAKSFILRPAAYEADLQLALESAPRDDELKALKQAIGKNAHLLTGFKTSAGVLATIMSRLYSDERLVAMYLRHARSLEHPYLKPYWPMPELDPALIRTVALPYGIYAGGTVALGGNCQWAAVGIGADGFIEVFDIVSGSWLSRLEGHSEPVVKVVFDRAGSQMASADSGGRIRVWDTTSWQPTRELKRDSAGISALAFDRAGENLVSGTQDGTIRIWNVNAERILKTLDLHNDQARQEKQVTAVAIYGLGQQVASGDAGGRVSVVDIESERQLFALPGLGWVNALRFSEDGAQLVISHGRWSPENEVWSLETWDLVTNQRKLSVQGEVYAHTFQGGSALDEYGQRFAHADGTGPILVYDTSTGEQIHTLLGHPRGAESISFGQSHHWLTSFGDGHLRVWNTDLSQQGMAKRNHVDWIRTAGFSLDGRLVVSAGNSGELLVRDINEGGKPLQSFAHASAIELAKFATNDQQVVTVDFSREIRVWDLTLRSSRLVAEVPKDSNYPVLPKIALDFGGRHLATVIDDGIQVIDLDLGTCVQQRSGLGHSIIGLAFDGPGEQLVFLSRDGIVRIWEWSSRRDLRILTDRYVEDFASLAVDAAGQRAAFGGYHGSLQMWDVKSGRRLYTVDTQMGYLGALAFNPDGCLLASGDSNGHVAIWDTKNGHPVSEIRIDEGVMQIDWHPKGCLMAIAGVGGLHVLHYADH